MRKILFLHPDLGIGGAERLIIDLAIVLCEHKYTVKILTNHYDKNHCFPETKQDAFKIEQIGNFVPRNVFGYFHAALAYLKFFLLTIHVLLFEDTANSTIICDQISLPLFMLKCFSSASLIFYCHFPDLLLSERNSFLKRAYRYPIDFVEEHALNYADLILVNSKFTSSVCQKTFSKLRKELSLLYPSINTKYIDSLELCSCDELPEAKSTIFLSINRFDRKKNLELALEALVILREQISAQEWSKLLLVLAGGYDFRLAENRDYYAQLKKFCKDKNIEQNVLFIKSPSDKKKFSLLKQCTCLLYTPVNEHFGIVPLEAMYFGKPVIAMDSGGPLETVQHNVTGYHSKPTKESLAFFMKEFLFQNAAVLGQNGRTHFDRLFSYETFTNNFLQYINSLN